MSRTVRWSRGRGLRVAGLALVVGVGCGDPAEREVPGVVVRDSAGIRIVENPAAAMNRVVAVSAEPELVLGSLEGEPEYQFFRVAAAARLSDGSFVVANGGTREVRFYGPDGEHRRTVGGAGQGPEEYRYPVAILVGPGDTLQVQDFLDRVRYAPDGTFLGRESADMGRLQAAVGPDAFPEGGLWLADGTLFTPAFVREERRGPPDPGPPFRPPLRFLRISGDLSTATLLGDFGGIRQQFVQVDAGPRGVAPVVPPFAVSTSYAAGASDGTLVVGDSDFTEVRLFRADGREERARWPADREPVTTAEVEAWLEVQRNAPWTQNRLPQMERAWAAMEVPARKAAFGRVAMGRDGSVWVPESTDFDADPATFLVFTAEGHLRGRASLPGPFTVMDAGPGWVLGIWRDENEVEYLRLHRVGS